MRGGAAPYRTLRPGAASLCNASDSQPAFGPLRRVKPARNPYRAKPGGRRLTGGGTPGIAAGQAQPRPEPFPGRVPRHGGGVPPAFQLQPRPGKAGRPQTVPSAVAGGLR